MKISVDSIKAFFVHHVEKIGFGIALMLVALFVYSGYSLDGYKRTPPELRSAANGATQRITEDTWTDKLETEKIDPQREFSKEVKESNRDINSSGYPTHTPWKAVNVQPIVRRKDPELFAPINLEVDVMYGPLAMRSRGIDPLSELPTAPRPEPPQKKKKRPAPPRRRGPEGAMPGEDFGMETEGMDTDMGEGMFGMLSGDVLGSRIFPNPPAYWIRPLGPSVATVDTTGGGPVSTGVVPQGKVVVAVKALVRFQKQFDEYERVLQDCIGYAPRRDRPEFLMFSAERAEVGDDPDAPLVWKPISHTEYAKADAARWMGRGRELIDSLYAMPGVLTMDVPPLLLRDTDYFGTHSEIPRVTDKKAAADVPATTDDPEIRPDMGVPMIPTRPGVGTQYQDPGMTETLPGSDYGSGESGATGDSEDLLDSVDMTEYKLVRFFDTTALPGKKYRYRVQVLITDPNHPIEGDLVNQDRILDPEVLVRLAEVAKQEVDLARRTQGRARRIYYRQSPWSEPSPVVETPVPGHLLAGPGEATPSSKTYPTPTGGVLSLVDPKAKLAGVTWDLAFATDISYSVDATLGTVLNTKSDLKIIHPVTLEMKLAEDRRFRSDTVVVDIRAGDVVGGGRENPQAAPAQIAAVDAKGNLVVRDEVDDVELFRIYAFVDDVAAPAAGLPGMEDDGLGEQNEFFDGESRGRRRRGDSCDF